MLTVCQALRAFLKIFITVYELNLEITLFAKEKTEAQRD